MAAEWWNGRMAKMAEWRTEWQNGGRMTGWLNGGQMAEWSNGKMVEWQRWQNGGRNGGIAAE
jgi:hypothetical protein